MTFGRITNKLLNDHFNYLLSQTNSLLSRISFSWYSNLSRFFSSLLSPSLPLPRGP